MKYYKVSEEFIKVLHQYVQSKPYSEVSGIMPGFGNEEHCSPISEEAPAPFQDAEIVE
jgi:hypothetical protein